MKFNWPIFKLLRYMCMICIPVAWELKTNQQIYGPLAMIGLVIIGHTRYLAIWNVHQLSSSRKLIKI